MDLRSKTLSEVLDLKFYKREQLSLNVLRQLPSYRYVLERYFTESNNYDAWPYNLPNRNSMIALTIADELMYVWINMGVIPASRTTVNKAVQTLVFKDYLKNLKDVTASKRGPKWNERYRIMKGQLEDGFDIKRKDKTKSDEMASYLGTDTAPEEEEELYKDNCVRNEDGRCPRIRWVGGVDTAWQRAANERLRKMEKSERFARQRELRIAQEKEQLQRESTSFMPSAVDVDSQPMESEELLSDDEEFSPEDRAATCAKKRLKEATDIPATRSSSRSEPSQDPVGKFPDIEVRSGEKTFNVQIKETLVVMMSVYKVEARKAGPLLQYIANTLFGQKWEVIDEDESEDGSSKSDGVKKRKKKSFDNYTLPTRKTMAAWVKDFSYLNLKRVAEAMVNASKDRRTVRYGCDDTVKAAGNNKLDMKTAKVTIMGDDHKKDSFSTGFYENISHSGTDSAKIVSHDIAKLGLLVGVSYDEMLTLINFFMTDRAGDSDTMLTELGIDHDKRLKCNAHILLAIDVAIDKVFKDTETVIGLSHLIGQGAEHVFNSTKNSIWFLGMIAIAKLLSPSHSKESISLFKDYKKYLFDNGEEENTKIKASKFKGFRENRFGRIGEISEAITTHGDLVHRFFDEQVNEHQNKLVLAVSAYINSDWFMICCKVANFFYQKTTLKLKKALGIDEFKSKSTANTDETESVKPSHNWTQMKVSLHSAIADLDELTHQHSELSNGMFYLFLFHKES